MDLIADIRNLSNRTYRYDTLVRKITCEQKVKLDSFLDTVSAPIVAIVVLVIAVLVVVIIALVAAVIAEVAIIQVVKVVVVLAVVVVVLAVNTVVTHSRQLLCTPAAHPPHLPKSSDATFQRPAPPRFLPLAWINCLRTMISYYDHHYDILSL